MSKWTQKEVDKTGEGKYPRVAKDQGDKIIHKSAIIGNPITHLTDWDGAKMIAREPYWRACQVKEDIWNKEQQTTWTGTQRTTSQLTSMTASSPQLHLVAARNVSVSRKCSKNEHWNYHWKLQFDCDKNFHSWRIYQSDESVSLTIFLILDKYRNKVQHRVYINIRYWYYWTENSL